MCKATACRTDPAEAIISPETGFNVIGYASGNLGLGVYARSVIDSVLARGFPVAVLDLDPGFGRKNFELRHRDLFVESARALPHAINCFVLPPPALEDVAAYFGSLLTRRGALNAAFSMWELPRVPEAWHAALQMFDVLAAGSPFIRQSFESSVPDVNVIDAPLFLPLRTQAVARRPQFGLDNDSCYCVASFEPYSDIERKNIEAVIAAYQAAAAVAPALKLIIKVNNAASGGAEHADLARLRQRTAGISGLRWLTDRMPRPALQSLIASCDICISLHRSEGYGLSLYEAMQLGKPVVATAWSGNLGYMNSASACLVDYRLVPVPRDGAAYYSSRGHRQPVFWAEARVEDAAAWLIRLAGSRTLREEKGAAARSAIANYQRQAEKGGFLDYLQALQQQLRERAPATARVARYLPMALRQRNKLSRRVQGAVRKVMRKGARKVARKIVGKALRKARGILG